MDPALFSLFRADANIFARRASNDWRAHLAFVIVS